MAITTYDDLKTSIANWLNRDDLTAVIPDFISLAEADINRKVRHWRMENRSTAIIDTRYTGLPDDFLQAIRFHLDVDERSVEQSSPSSLQRHREKSSDIPGRPKYFSITSGQLEVWPSPDADYTGELYYYGRTPALGDDNASNWLLEYFPDVYLYGSLVHSAPYLVDDARAQTWAALYQSAVDGITGDSEKSKFGGSGLRMRINSF